MRGLYAIADVGTLRARRLEPVAFCEAVLSAPLAALQLRAKDATPRETLALLRAIAPMCRRSSVPLVANDRPDWAKLAGCDMVHVGQDDMPIERVRRLVPGLGVGVSTHNREQLDAALGARPSYVAFGPVFETTSKRNPDPVTGVVELREAYRRAVAARTPLVAIGGITRENAPSLLGATDAVAVIGELLPPPTVDGERLSTSETLYEVAARAHALSQLFGPEPVLATGSR
jgi:thiamine-phosphate pyrophosphorylase